MNIALNLPPALAFVKIELRALQGFLSLYGLESIDLENFSVEWIPDSEEEKNELQLNQYEIKAGTRQTDHIPPIPFNIVARAFLAGDDLIQVELPLNFFRRGLLDTQDSRYIEAIYDFYFLLETWFANGKFKSEQVKQEFKRSQLLVDAIFKTLSLPKLEVFRTPELVSQFQRALGRRDAAGICEWIVDLRGKLHHNNIKRRDNWHPENQERYKMEAYLLMSICTEVAFGIAWKYCKEPKVLNTFRQLFPPSRFERES